MTFIKQHMPNNMQENPASPRGNLSNLLKNLPGTPPSMSQKRRNHIDGVAKVAQELARKCGEDPEKAKTAALYHDILREAPIEELNKLVKEFHLGDEYLNAPGLAHGKVAAALLENEGTVTDPDILNAVRYHTTGRAGMSDLEKIIYLADLIEPGRDYSGFDRIRQPAEKSLNAADSADPVQSTDSVGSTVSGQSLNAACLVALEQSLAHMKKTGKNIHQDTARAIADLKIKIE